MFTANKSKEADSIPFTKQRYFMESVKSITNCLTDQVIPFKEGQKVTLLMRNGKEVDKPWIE